MWLLGIWYMVVAIRAEWRSNEKKKKKKVKQEKIEMCHGVYGIDKSFS